MTPTLHVLLLCCGGVWWRAVHLLVIVILWHYPCTEEWVRVFVWTHALVFMFAVPHQRPSPLSVGRNWPEHVFTLSPTNCLVTTSLESDHCAHWTSPCVNEAECGCDSSHGGDRRVCRGVVSGTWPPPCTLGSTFIGDFCVRCGTSLTALSSGGCGAAGPGVLLAVGARFAPKLLLL